MGICCSVYRVNAVTQGGVIEARQAFRWMFRRNVMLTFFYGVIIALPYFTPNVPPPDTVYLAFNIAVMAMLLIDSCTSGWVCQHPSLVSVQATLASNALTVPVYATKEVFFVLQMMNNPALQGASITTIVILPLAVAVIVVLSKVLQVYIVAIVLRRMKAGALPPTLDPNAPLLPVVVGQPVAGTPVAGEPLDTPAR